MRGLLSALFVALLVAGCNQRSASDQTEPEPAKAIEYGSMPQHVGQTVTVVGWVLGAGESFHVEGRDASQSFYFVLVNEPEVDWETFFQDYEAVEKLVKALQEGDRAGSTSSQEVREFSRLQDAFHAWRGLILGQEARNDVTAWAKFSDNPIGAEFDAVPDGPLVLVRPKREELAAAAERLLEEYRAIERSAEVRATGQLLRTDAEDGGERRAQNLDEALRKKPFLLVVEKYEILRTARDMLKKGPQVGADELVEPGQMGGSGR